ncbi:MAG: L-aspartate oxidase [Solirubrobacteraceae bacterium]|jgi:L-aspartate oxidase|nr:L-aspartate oxidase [Solirubrobacteraceae bacterium]
MPRERIEAEIAVVGAGAAGLYAALTAARAGARVALISATPLARTASYWAQGGLAAALAADDSPDRHREDTEIAGRGLVRTSAAAVLCRDAPRTVADLEALDVHFDRDGHGTLALALEGGHSRRRVVHAGGSATGRRVVRQLSALVVETPGIEVLEGSRAAVLWTVDGRCVGVACEDGRTVHARGVVLATGGAAALWARTTNPPGSLGVGLLLAREAGAELADLEFMQFHPTAVTGIKGREGFLVTEAIRGEGARLLDADGERFVDELAPRDEVARAIRDRMDLSGRAFVELDMRDVDPQLFPNVVGALQEAGLDPTRALVPVAPAAHYGMGGIVSDLDGATTVPGLYAVGEAACTGLHGANRLASNSLSECFVFGARAARAAIGEPSVAPGEPPAPRSLPAPSRASREALWRDAGLVRTRAGLERLLDDRDPLVALIARHALLREESRGAHARADFPAIDPALDLHHSVSRAPDDPPVFERWT